ncbi:MAG: hypothetical protein AAGD25_29630 [Cyanobacteria bacterium P01_F01_bin.150]
MSRIARTSSKGNPKGRSKGGPKDKASRSHPKTSSTQTKLKRSPTFERRWRSQLEDSITAIAWSSNGQNFAIASAAGDVLLGTPDHSPAPLPQMHKQGEQDEAITTKDAMSSLGFSATGQFLAASGQSGQVMIWSLTEAEPIVVFNQNLTKDWIDCLAWHPSAPILAIGVGPNAQLWDMTTQTLVTEFAFNRSSVQALAWHPQGNHLAVSGHGGVSVWTRSNSEENSGENLTADNWSQPPEFIEVPGASIAVQWSLDGRYLGSGNLDRTLTVVNWGNPLPWFMQGFPGKVRQLSWSHDSTPSGSPLLAAACTNGIIIWERDAKQDGIWNSRVLEKHTQTVKAIAFQPHTFTLASASQDGRVILWHNAKSVSQTLKGAKQGWSAIAWSPDGTSLITGGQAGELILWAPSSRGQGF